jgi:hypothetical protein
MCFGNDDPPQAQFYGEPPPVEEIMDVIDETAGIQAITVTGPDGKKQRKIMYLPKTPEQQENDRIKEAIISSAIRNMSNLPAIDRNFLVPFEPLIQTFANMNNETMKGLAQVADIGDINASIEKFRQMQNGIIESSFERSSRQAEESFAHRGVSDSTAANEFRAAMAKEKGLALQEGDVKANMYGEDLAARRLARNAQAFGLQEIGRDKVLRGAATEYDLRRQQEADRQNNRQAAIAENAGLMGIKDPEIARAMSSNAPQLANQTFQIQNAAKMERYNADITRKQMNYQNQLAQYNSRPTSFTDWALNTAGTLGGAIFTASPKSLAGRIGSRIF